MGGTTDDRVTTYYVQLSLKQEGFKAKSTHGPQGPLRPVYLTQRLTGFDRVQESPKDESERDPQRIHPIGGGRTPLEREVRRNEGSVEEQDNPSRNTETPLSRVVVYRKTFNDLHGDPSIKGISFYYG